MTTEVQLRNRTLVPIAVSSTSFDAGALFYLILVVLELEGLWGICLLVGFV
jgi:hypothetical protein